MLHPIRWLIRLVVLAVVVAVGFAAWYVFGSKDPVKPVLRSCTASGPSGATTPAGSWKIRLGKDVFVGYRITEVFKGDVIHKSAVGRTPKVSGSLKIAGNQLTVAKITADMQQLSSDRGTRDDYIHSHAIESDKFKSATFTLTKPVVLPSPLSRCSLHNLTATGSLTLHGVTKTVVAKLQAQWDGATIKVDAADIPIKLVDYKISAPHTSVTGVDDHGSIEFALTFVPA